MLHNKQGHPDIYNCRPCQKHALYASAFWFILFTTIQVVCCCRAEGGCSEPYLSADLALVRCYTCNRMGHLCCKEGPQEPPEPSCHNCGDAGHMAVDCRMTKPQKVSLSVLSCMHSHAHPSSPAPSCMALWYPYWAAAHNHLWDVLHSGPLRLMSAQTCAS